MKYFILYFKYFLMHKIGIFALSTHCGHPFPFPLPLATLLIKYPTKHNLSLGRIENPQRGFRANFTFAGLLKKVKKRKKKNTQQKAAKGGNENEKWKMYFQQITHKFYSCRFHAASAPQKICFII